MCSKNTVRLFKNNDYIEHVQCILESTTFINQYNGYNIFRNSFKFVLKLVPDNKTSDKYLADSSILKILDILNMCEKWEKI